MRLMTELVGDLVISILLSGPLASPRRQPWAVKKYPETQNGKFGALEGLVAAPTARSIAVLNGFGSPPKAPQFRRGHFFTVPLAVGCEPHWNAPHG